jgi:hypothetical protein
MIFDHIYASMIQSSHTPLICHRHLHGDGFGIVPQARLRFSSVVSQADVDEAIRLFHAAKASTEPQDKGDDRVSMAKSEYDSPCLCFDELSIITHIDFHFN